jgi:hypothetical protein
MANLYSTGNRAEFDQLRKLARSLTAQQVASQVGAAGWTAGGILGHLAFWDQRALVLLRR